MAVKLSPPATAFAKALRSLETGGLTYSDVLAEIKEMLAAGASPTELREILLSRDSIEPLSVQARVELLGLLNGAMLREKKRAAAAEALNLRPESAAPLQVNPEPVPAFTPASKPPSSRGADEAQRDAVPSSPPAPSAAETAAVARVAELETELGSVRAALESERTKSREAAKAAASAAADSLASLEAARSHLNEAAEDAERYRAETISLRNELSQRDSNLAQLRQALTKRDSQLAALTLEHTELSTALETRVKNVAQLGTDLQAARAREAALTADLAKARTVLESEQNRAQGNSKSLVDKLVAAEAQARTLRDALAAREAELSTLQREHANQTTVLQAQRKGGTQMDADLQAARARADALAGELKASQEAAHGLNIRLERSESVLATVRAELEDVKREPDSQTIILPGAPAGQMQQPSAAPQHSQVIKFPQAPPSAAHMPTVKLESEPAAAHVTPVAAAAPVRASKGKKFVSPRLVAIAAVVMVAAIAVWMFSRRTPAPEETKAPVPVAEVPAAGKTIRDCPTCPVMTVLPTGRFKQGSPGGEGNTPSFERPQHWVNIGKSIAMSTTPVTVDEFGQFIAANGRDMQGCDTYDGDWKHRQDKSWKDPGFNQTGTHPVTCVSSNDAAAYAAWLSTQTGHRYRLPSASEWEYAARAGAEAVQPWGPVATDACRYANVADQSAADQYPGWRIFDCDDAYANTSPVGSFEANAFGLKDMLGNVFQWTDDCWNADYTGAPVDGSARSDGDCTQRELRGGSWFSSPDYVRANYRNRFAADYRTSSVGIRLVREVGP